MKPSLLKISLASFIIFLTIAISCKKENILPTCSISKPTNGAQINYGETISVAIEAEDEDGLIAQIIVKLNNKNLETLTAAPYSLEITPEDYNAGSNSLNISVYDDEDASVDEEIKFTINPIGPTLTTSEITNITESSAVCGGNITDDGGSSITARGVCWNLKGNPTIEESFTENGDGTGSFVSLLNELSPASVYFIRAYATNETGTSYGNEIVFNTSETKPVISTKEITNITDNTAVSGGIISFDGGADITQRGVCWNVNGSPTVNDNKTEDGSGDGTFSSTIGELVNATKYYVRAYATNKVGTSYGNEKEFSTSAIIPTLTTLSATSVSYNGLQSGGNITDDGGAAITMRGVCWNKSGNPTVNNNKTEDDNGTGEFTSTVTGLEPNTKYYIKSYATNDIGTAYGNEISVTTSTSIPSLTTKSVSGITITTAISGGNVTSNNGETITERGICINTTGLPTTGDITIKSTGGIGDYTVSISSLIPGTKYYVRAYAINSNGTAYGNEQEFTTLSTIATLSTLDVSSIGDKSAQSGGNITTDGGAAVTIRGVCWNKAGNPSISDSKSEDGSGDGTYSSTLINLEPHTKYYVKAFATNSIGTAYGEEVSFTTLSSVPVVLTGNITSVTSSSASCSGEVTDGGGETVTDRGICWNLAGNPTVSDNSSSNGSGLGDFGVSLADLLPGTTYYVRAFAENTNGTAYGEQKSFKTLAVLATIETANISSVTYNGAVSGGTITDDGGGEITQKGVCWNTSGNPTISNSKTNDGTGIGAFSSTISGLSGSTTYYVRAYATSSAGTAYGPSKSFTTLEYLNASKWLYYDDGSFGSGDYFYSTTSGNRFIIRFSRPYGWGNYAVKSIKIKFEYCSSYSRFNLYCHTAYTTNTDGIRFPSGTQYTLASSLTPSSNNWADYTVNKSLSSDYFYVTLYAANYYQIGVYVDILSSNLSSSQVHSLLEDSYGNTAWFTSGSWAIRAYVEDISGKGTWVDGIIEEVESPPVKMEGTPINNYNKMNFDFLREDK